MKAQVPDSVLQLVQNMADISGSSLTGAAAPISKDMDTTEKKKKEQHFRSIKTSGIKRPIMHPSVFRDVRAAMSRYENASKWVKWGLHRIRKQGTAILLQGPPGTGKTSIALWMGKVMNRTVKTLDVSTVCSGEPGASERTVIEFFELCRKEKCMVFMDECDAMLGNREEISADGRTWQLSTMEQILMQLNVFEGPVVAATNHIGLMDPAIADRFIYIIKVDRPDYPRRLLLWKQKWPAEFPLKLKEKDLKNLAKHDLTGRQVENVLLAVGGECIERNILPTWVHFAEAATREEGKHIGEH